jgi:hypothetical protein
MYLVSLHDDLIRGISLGIHVIEVEVATCAVAIYHLDNTFLDEDLVIYGAYGAEGENLNETNQLNVRVLAN